MRDTDLRPVGRMESSLHLSQTLHGTSLALADRRAVELELWPDMQHCFQILQFLPESGRAIQSIERFVARQTGWLSAAAHVPAAPEAHAHTDWTST